MKNISRRSKAAIQVTPARRVGEFGSRTFITEGGQLMCTVCNITVDHIR